MFFGQGPAGHHQHDAFKVVVVVAHDQVHPFGIAHGRINPLEEGDGTLVGRLTGAALHVHVVDFVTCRATDRKKCVSCCCRCCIYDLLKAGGGSGSLGINLAEIWQIFRSYDNHKNPNHNSAVTKSVNRVLKLY